MIFPDRHIKVSLEKQGELYKLRLESIIWSECLVSPEQMEKQIEKQIDEGKKHIMRTIYGEIMELVNRGPDRSRPAIRFCDCACCIKSIDPDLNLRRHLTRLFDDVVGPGWNNF